MAQIAFLGALWILNLFGLHLVVISTSTIMAGIAVCIIGAIWKLEIKFSAANLLLLSITRSLMLCTLLFKPSVITLSIGTIVAMFVLVPMSMFRITKDWKLDSLLQMAIVIVLSICDSLISGMLEPLIPR